MTYEESLRLLVWDKAGLALIGLTLGSLLTHYLARRSKSEDRAALAIEDLARRKREATVRLIDDEIALLERKIQRLPVAFNSISTNR